jgi:hypothetical protein
MEFKHIKDALARNFEQISANNTLFETDIDKDVLWNLYLDSFPEGTNPVYRERRVYDCSACHQFIKNIGGTVYIDDNFNAHSIFEFDTNSETFQPVMDALAAYVTSKSILDIYLNDSRKVGINQSREILDDGTVITWDHFFVKLPSHMYDTHKRGIPTKKARIRDRKNVFKRSLDEISMDAIDTVLELIYSNTLYKGEEWKSFLESLRENKCLYMDIPEDKRDAYTWKRAINLSDAIGRIRNHSIGVLLVDISEGMDLDTAVRRYEKIVAPTNYKRPKAIYTKKMLEEARKKITELGYMESLPRRFATLDDITVNNILFSNRDAAKRIGGDIFDDMMAEVVVDPKKFSRVEEVSAEKFVNDILPTAKSVEVLLENKHAQNMVSLIAPVNKDAKSMFKWNNAFSWAYTGNITDSDIRENVKSAGGRVDGVLRFSIQWNEDGANNCDLDAHCSEPGNYEIYFGSAKKPCFSPTHGQLDIDIVDPRGNVAVENITWDNKRYMHEGDYIFRVHQYSGSAKHGFRAEVEIDGTIHSFDYNKPMRRGEMVNVAVVHMDAYGNFTIKELLPSNVSTREVWGLKTNTFVPVTVVMYSPNYWDEQQGIGHRHYFFMLKDCVNPEQPNGFYNEFLDNRLNEHKRVFEALGSKLAVVDANDQLSGLGFSATKRNDLIVKVKGATERVFKVKF